MESSIDIQVLSLVLVESTSRYPIFCVEEEHAYTYMSQAWVGHFCDMGMDRISSGRELGWSCQNGRS